MALSPTKITPVLDPNCLDSGNAASEVFPPLATTTTLANDVGAGEQILRNQTHTLNEVKVDVAGDTMTGQLIVTPSTAVDGIIASGGTGKPGLVATNGTAQTATAPTIAGQAAGAFQLTGTDPNQGVDPGGNDVLHGANITKAWGTVSLTGGTPFATQDDYNVTDVTEPVANIYQINFVRAFANATYAITFTPHAPGVGVSLSTKTTTTCRFNVWDTTAPGTPLSNQTVDFVAVGRQ